MIGRLLDGGAHGIIAPRIETVAEAELVAGRAGSPRAAALADRPAAAAGDAAHSGARAEPRAGRHDRRTDPAETPTGIANADAIASWMGWT